MDVHQYLYGRPSVFIWTTIRTSMDFHQLSFERPSVFKLTSVSFYIDIHQYFSRRPSVFIRTPSVPLWTSISFHKDIRKNRSGRSSAFIRTFISTSVDNHQFSSRHASSLRASISYQRTKRTSLDVHQLSYVRL